MNADPELIHCIASHGPRYFGVEPENTMDKMIYVFDELSGFIHASALVRPTRYEGMDVKGILKKLKTAGFATLMSREDTSRTPSAVSITRSRRSFNSLSIAREASPEHYRSNRKAAWVFCLLAVNFST